MRRSILVLILLGMGGAFPVTTGAAAPERVVTDTLTYDFFSPCGPVHEVDTGRLTSMTFFNKDGTFNRFAFHYPSITSVYTLTDSGKSLTLRSSNIVLAESTTTTSPNGSTYTEVDRFLGLNYSYVTPDGKKINAAGKGSFVYTVTFDATGNVLTEDLVDTATPHLTHITDLLCAL